MSLFYGHAIRSEINGSGLSNHPAEIPEHRSHCCFFFRMKRSKGRQRTFPDPEIKLAGMDSDRVAFRTLVVCCAGHLLCHLTMLMFPTLLLTMPQDLGVSTTYLGWAGWFGYLLFGVGAVGAGCRAADRVMSDPFPAIPDGPAEYELP